VLDDEAVGKVRLAERAVVTITFVVVMVARGGEVLLGDDDADLGMARRILERAAIAAAEDEGLRLLARVDMSDAGGIFRDYKT
jgi:hypothetical protein